MSKYPKAGDHGTMRKLKRRSKYMEGREVIVTSVNEEADEIHVSSVELIDSSVEWRKEFGTEPPAWYSTLKPKHEHFAINLKQFLAKVK